MPYAIDIEGKISSDLCLQKCVIGNKYFDDE